MVTDDAEKNVSSFSFEGIESEERVSKFYRYCIKFVTFLFFISSNMVSFPIARRVIIDERRKKKKKEREKIRVIPVDTVENKWSPMNRISG